MSVVEVVEGWMWKGGVDLLVCTILVSTGVDVEQLDLVGVTSIDEQHETKNNQKHSAS